MSEHDEQFGAVFLEWWLTEPVAPTGSEPASAMEDLRSFLDLLDRRGFAIVRKVSSEASR